MKRSSDEASREDGGDEDAGSARLAVSRQRAAQHKMRAATLLMLVPTTVFSVMMIAAAQSVFHEWRSYESEARIARAQLGALNEQLDIGKRRLSSLRSPKGREQILAEHGFIRPGDRMLLFPTEPGAREEVQGTGRASQDIAARRATHRAVPTSAWDRAARATAGWFGQSSGSPDSQPSASSSSQDGHLTGEGTVSPADRIVAPEDAADERHAN